MGSLDEQYQLAREELGRQAPTPPDPWAARHADHERAVTELHRLSDRLATDVKRFLKAMNHAGNPGISKGKYGYPSLFLLLDNPEEPGVRFMASSVGPNEELAWIALGLKRKLCFAHLDGGMWVPLRDESVVPRAWVPSDEEVVKSLAALLARNGVAL